MENKKVSIVVCTYNGEKYLREQIDSLLAQTYPIYEIIIQDDRSIDGTWAIIEEYMKEYPRLIKGVLNENNLGWNQNFYAAILNTTGDYIACCDQDDIWMPNKIERQISEISDKLLHVCSSYYWTDEVLIPRVNRPVTLEHMSLYFEYCGHQFLLGKDIKEYVSFGQEIDMAHDRFLALVAQYTNSIIVSDELLVKWRRHNTNTTGNLAIDTSTGFHKIKYSIKRMMNDNKSDVINRAGNKYYKLFRYLYKKDSTPRHSKDILMMWKNIIKQNVFAYIKVGYYIGKMKNEIGVFGDKNNIKTMYSVFTYPFRWWYIHKEDL